MDTAPRSGGSSRDRQRAATAGPSAGSVAALLVLAAAALLTWLSAPARAQEDGASSGEVDDVTARLAGSGRLSTAIEISRDSYPADGGADAVVLARAGEFADALAGTPLAVDRGAPMLITHSDSLAPAVADEIERVLGEDATKTVYLLGGSAALSESVQRQVTDLGYRVRRLAGATRFETAVAIAEELGPVDSFLLTTGTTFADALSAGPAAAAGDGAVLLTAPETQVATTRAHLDAHSETPRIAIGGPAADAYPGADAVVGSTRAATSVAVAERFFSDPPAAGLARSTAFPDALTGGAHIGALTAVADASGPMLLTAPERLAGPVADYLCGADTLSTVSVYGGTSAITSPVAALVDSTRDGTGCADGDAALSGSTVLHPRGAGLAHAGMTLHQVEATTGTTLAVSGFADFGGRCYYARPRGVSAYTLMVLAPGDRAPADPRDGVVARASTSAFEAPVTATHAGIRPGDTRAQVEATYGAGNLAVSEHVYQPDGVYLDYHVEGGDFGLRFEVGGDDAVQSIHAGDGGAITFIEGCA